MTVNKKNKTNDDDKSFISSEMKISIGAGICPV